jgi:ABC-type lipoprotein release transport system permease subunit
MDSLITGINKLFNDMFWPQLANVSNWFLTNPLGQLIIFCALISIIIGVIIFIVTLGRNKKED